MLALLVLLPLGAITVLAARFDPDQLKPRLVAAIGQATGRTLGLAGPIRLRWALHPTLSLTRATLANLPGGSRPDMARVERIDAQISLLPLLQHRLEIVRLTLIGPNILFEQVGSHPNWVFDRPAPPPGATPAPAAATGSSSRTRLDIRHVEVVNGMVTFHFPARTKVIGLRSLDYDHAAGDGPLGLDAVLVYSDFQPFTLHVRASPPPGTREPRIDTRWTTTLDFAAFDATVSAHGTMDLVSDYDLAVEARIPKLEALNALLPEMHLPPVHGMVLTTRIGNGRARGELPVIGATHLSVAHADLGAWLPGLSVEGFGAALPTAGGLASLSGTILHGGRRIAIGGTVGVPEHPDAPAQVPLDIRLTTNAAPEPDRAALTGRIGLRQLGFDGLDAAMSLHAAHLADYRPVVSALLPPVTGLALQGRLAIPADRTSLALQEIVLHADQVDATGALRLGHGRTQALSASLHATRLDLDALLPEPATAATRPKPATAAKTGLFPTTPIPWHALRGPSLDVDARLDAVTLRRRAWTGLSLAARLQDGRIDQARFALIPPGGGAVQGTLSADASTTPATVALDLHAPSIPLALLADQAGLPGPVSGNLLLHTTLHARGDTPHALAASLDGPFSLTLVGGSLSDAALTRLAATALDELRIKVPTQGQTPIRCFGVIGQFTSGLGRLPVIALDTGYLRLSGEGQVDLGAETLALKLHPLAHLAGAAVAVPVLVDGSFNDIHSRLDASGLDKVGLLVDALFGGDHPSTCTDAGLLPAPAHR